jgi:hypothetical protein
VRDSGGKWGNRQERQEHKKETAKGNKKGQRERAKRDGEKGWGRKSEGGGV